MKLNSLFWLLFASYFIFSIVLLFIFPLHFWLAIGSDLALVMAISFFVSRRVSLPLKNLSEIANRVAKGDFKNQFPWSESNEIAFLSTAMQTMSKQLEEKFTTILMERNQKEAILSSMTDGVILIDCDMRILSINSFATRLIDIEAPKLVGVDVGSVIRQPDFQLFVRRLVAPHEKNPESIFIDYANIPFQIHGTCLFDSQGIKTGALVMLHDLSPVKQLETIRKDFVSNVSHELKTPIALVQGCLETLEPDDLSSQERLRFIAMAKHHADRLSQIVDDLLMLARLEQSSVAIKLDYCRIESLFEGVKLDTELILSEKNVILDCQIEPELMCECNSALIQHALVNLIKNALQHAQTPKIVLGAKSHLEGTIEFYVQDFGVGIPEIHLTRLFERFYRIDQSRSGQEGNTGLGLALVKHIVQAHKGQVEVKSTPGQGSVFHIFLPQPKGE
jgi:two-component system phosphate regulon sensor histidine kinase PhoR